MSQNTLWHNIPNELRSFPNWVVSGPNKIPLNPRTGQAASVTDPATWATFEEATRAGYRNIGFVLTDSDPYTIIDLDNKPEKPASVEENDLHERILKQFDSYTERSASGAGYHIIVKGRLPSGVHKDKVEVYSAGRYMICTGNVVRQSPIKDYQPILDMMYGQMKPAQSIELVDKESLLSDVEVVEMGMRAVNAEKFEQLCNGLWEGDYPSQSEADFALLAILAFYTPDNEQVRRLFRYSKLGRREKAMKNDVYLDRCLGKIRAVQLPGLDFTEYLKSFEQKVASKVHPEVPPDDESYTSPTPANGHTNGTMELPPGLVGEMASYFYRSAHRPVQDIALTSAIGLMAGVVGRAYNVSKTGLNQYIILLAKTGVGKEGAARGINNLIAAVRPRIPMVDQFIGPSNFASGQSMIKVLDEHPCFVSILGEFGLTLQQLCDASANASQIMLRKVLLDLYSKSGWNDILRSSVYADVEKNTKNIQAPNVTLLAESTPDNFFSGLDSSHIGEGLIPRFSIIEYTGGRPPRNEAADIPPEQGLLTRFEELVAIALTAQNSNAGAVPVQIDQNAKHQYDKLDREADHKINGPESSVETELWNRVHLKALKLGALLAVGIQPHQPVITGPLAEWAIKYVKKDLDVVSTRFSEGDVGKGDSKQMNDVIRAVKTYLNSSYEKMASYGVEQAMFKERVIPKSYLQRRTANLSAFRNDRKGAIGALHNALAELCETDVLYRIPDQQVWERYKSRMRCYALGKHFKDR